MVTPAQEVLLGIKKGSGKIIGDHQGLNLKSIFVANRETILSQQGQSTLVVTLFNDLNGDGKRGSSERELEWAGEL